MGIILYFFLNMFLRLHNVGPTLTYDMPDHYGSLRRLAELGPEFTAPPYLDLIDVEDPMGRQPFVFDDPVPNRGQTVSGPSGYDASLAVGVFTTEVGAVGAEVGNTVHKVKPGERFSMWADENATTGFKWVFDLDASGDACKGHLKAVSDKYFAKPAAQAMMGVGGTRYVTFELDTETDMKGECTIPFVYTRPWEQGPAGWQSNPEA